MKERQLITHEAITLVEKDPNVIFGWEGPHRVLAVGYFAEDDIDVYCSHTVSDVKGARRCAEALRSGDGNDTHR